MTTKHTPGEWCVKHDKTGMPFIGIKSDPIDYPGTVAVIDGGYPEADARLISAAPDMVTALEALLHSALAEAETTHTTPAQDRIHDAARAAIRKARGE